MALLTLSFQLRPPQMQRDQSNHQSQRSRLRPDLHRQGRRERPLYGREPGVRALRVRAESGRERRCVESIGAEGWVLEECVECAAYEMSASAR